MKPLHLTPCLVLACGSCLGPPTTLRAGYAEFDKEGPGGKYSAPTVELDFPISYPWQKQPPRQRPQDAAYRDIVLGESWEPPGGKAQESAVQGRWWEDLMVVQSLVLLLVGGAAAEARKPAQRWLRQRGRKAQG